MKISICVIQFFDAASLSLIFVLRLMRLLFQLTIYLFSKLEILPIFEHHFLSNLQKEQTDC